ncbi:hypothetical protein B0H14DRAFT_2596335 [Mycena olivaceomarginata]|nr:hypothetical protein B0H14DRAFT_2596335 [Mycena olivaceomarginata]
MSNPITGLLSVEKPSPKRQQALPKQKCWANCATSARYREKHREEYLEKERERAARRRVHLKTLRDGDAELEWARTQARADSTQHRERLGAEGSKERGTWVCSYSQTFYFWVWGCEYSVSDEFFTLRPKNKPQDCQRWSARDHTNPALPQDPFARVGVWVAIEIVVIARAARRFMIRVEFGRTGCKGIEVDEALPNFQVGGLGGLGRHRNASSCQFYSVWAGRVRGVYSNSWIACAQTDGYTDANHCGFKKWADIEVWWRGLCRKQHQGGCPAFEPITFTLNPPNNTHPSSAACTRLIPAAVTVPAAAATRTMVPMPAPSPFGGGEMA